MLKNKFNSILRDYVKENLSPTESDRNLITEIYKSICSILGEKNMLQIGSYPRYTAIRPLHDLDTLWILGKWDVNIDQSEPLNALDLKIQNEYVAPSGLTFDTKLQTHSVTIEFKTTFNRSIFSLDIVPAYEIDNSKIYRVPEIIKNTHKSRIDKYLRGRKIDWILSDPIGYIDESIKLNTSNADFRKAVKFVKKWKTNLKIKDGKLKLKSFHLEQICARLYSDNQNIDLVSSVFIFFRNLPDYIEKSQFIDRADKNRKIDEYIDNMPVSVKNKIIEASDSLLIKLENFKDSHRVEDLLEVDFYSRRQSEQFIFDFVPIFIDDSINLRIDGLARRKEGFTEYKYPISTGFGDIEANNSIKFVIIDNHNLPNIDKFLWKVKNDNSCGFPRGEITENHTLNDPESTQYDGNHYVECYAIRNNICVAKARQNVVIAKKPSRYS